MRRPHPGSGIRRFARRIPREEVAALPCRRCRRAPARAFRQAPWCRTDSRCTAAGTRSDPASRRFCSVPGAPRGMVFAILANRSFRLADSQLSANAVAGQRERRARWRRRRPGSPRDRRCTAARKILATLGLRGAVHAVPHRLPRRADGRSACEDRCRGSGTRAGACRFMAEAGTSRSPTRSTDRDRDPAARTGYPLASSR